MTTTMKTMTLVQANHLIKKCDGLFRSAALAYERGNNSGDNTKLAFGENQCGRYRAQAEALLEPFGITVDYPGLYPSFTVNGYSEHTTEGAVSAALIIFTKAELPASIPMPLRKGWVAA